MAVHVMTPEAEATSVQADAAASPRGPDLLGGAPLATIGIVMTAWIGGLIWLAIAILNWLAS
ncbi:hypothetical protein AYJ54_02085 [Bradyrhizobium centrolobii]|uniref:Uncharacterized protein n=1 Tax=Bradyrhizobium centrolobii TaxID=1505087 RepID=A0A176YIQ9_9BRAD|nr:hypothetical protein [Bradyrhizobium centrolobii]OAF05709.1 hypothetical protein AYJ54_02085 [Bradyrhizobium centrolobii]